MMPLRLCWIYFPGWWNSLHQDMTRYEFFELFVDSSEFNPIVPVVSNVDTVILGKFLIFLLISMEELYLRDSLYDGFVDACLID